MCNVIFYLEFMASVRFATAAQDLPSESECGEELYSHVSSNPGNVSFGYAYIGSVILMTSYVISLLITMDSKEF